LTRRGRGWIRNQRSADPESATPIPSASEYLRVSFDRTGRERSNDEQHTDNLAAAPSFGIDRFAKPYRDTGSASRHARKRRDDFDRLLDDLDTGRFDADVLMLWESSRGSRKTGEWVDLLDRCEHAGVRIAVTTHGRVYDPTNARDRRSLLEDAVDSEYESAKTSQRTKRTARDHAAAGMPHGRIPYGYRRIYDPTTRRLVRQEADPTEAPVVVELYQRLAAGHSLTAIARDFEARGITSRGSAKVPACPFVAQTLRGIALAPVYRGQRVHSPGGRKVGTNRHDAEQTYDATWPALVDDDLWYAVHARLTDPARVTTRPGRAKHLLSMIARCDLCSGPLVSTDRYGARRYQCNAGHVLIHADKLDAWAEDQVLSLLTRPDVLQRLLPQAVDDKAMADARDDVARIRAEHDDLIAQVADGKLSARLAAGAEPGIVARLDLAEQRVRELTTPVGLRQLIDPGPQVVEQWDTLTMEVRREIVRLLFVKGLLGVLSVAGVNGGANTVQARVRLDGKRLRASKQG
jgi:DNA invertase Pin-like site-specific DNA recombinase